MIVVPLRTGTGVEGVLKVLSFQANTFDDQDVDTLRLIAGEIAASMRTAAEFEAKQALLADRTRVAEELARANSELEHRALHDALTGLPNRVLFQDRLEQTMRSTRRGDSSMALFLLDLDRFKEVNDTLGHEAGDILLQQVAVRLQNALRESDTIGRLGGDEFAIILPAIDAKGAAQVAERIHCVLEQPLTLEGHQIDVEASIGIALFPAHGEDSGTLLRHADAAMYEAKRADQGYCVFSPQGGLVGPAFLTLIGVSR
jgi:diguanylate cyclase (GGDEF)-like protein